MMSQYANSADYYRDQMLRYARALVDLADGMKEHEVAEETGLPASDAAELWSIIVDANELILSK